ncbi:hypothetical protein CC1G_05270 [Coprinopsis cinerea okayama7|uniref:Uncharacterized protein n=1 Tax=Coprinopsis cinerea (strain Okayama-7 / 130 / ATCC MYA-4618 / FGSC 9003) TaxID=240176 RepID=A8PCF5_COPC7|nr:hypothetical protein CC1G_05270 [Coprinopsis cinerea okayama7\|eukprot:XP_001840384.1 hypothetical protein CC1G_05270 [Coprinopsis cinerea okayama7\
MPTDSALARALGRCAVLAPIVQETWYYWVKHWDVGIETVERLGFVPSSLTHAFLALDLALTTASCAAVALNVFTPYGVLGILAHKALEWIGFGFSLDHRLLHRLFALSVPPILMALCSGGVTSGIAKGEPAERHKQYLWAGRVLFVLFFIAFGYQYGKWVQMRVTLSAVCLGTYALASLGIIDLRSSTPFLVILLLAVNARNNDWWAHPVGHVRRFLKGTEFGHMLVPVGCILLLLEIERDM